MIRLLVAFLFPLAGHICLLQFYFPISPSYPPELVSDTSVTVTLHQYKEEQAKKPAEPGTSRDKEKVPTDKPQQSDTDQLAEMSPPKTKKEKPQKIAPRTYKIKKRETPKPVPDQLCEQPIQTAPNKRRSDTEPPLSTVQTHKTEKTQKSITSHNKKNEALPVSENSPTPKLGRYCFVDGKSTPGWFSCLSSNYIKQRFWNS